ncbi:clustered mitochondria protein [Tanacetum coccineum]
MEDVSCSLSNLLSSPSKEIKCVESIMFLSFNPSPSYIRLVGDLLYLDVVILEGSKYCITGTTNMFYVKSSSGNTLEPKPTKAAYEATTLIGLLKKISSKFKKAFREIFSRLQIMFLTCELFYATKTRDTLFASFVGTKQNKDMIADANVLQGAIFHDDVVEYSEDILTNNAPKADGQKKVSDDVPKTLRAKP